MGSERVDPLGEYMRHRNRLRVDCLACKKLAILQPITLLETCRQRGWGHRMGEVEQRLRCGSCGSRRVRVGLAFEERPGQNAW